MRYGPFDSRTILYLFVVIVVAAGVAALMGE